MIIELGNHAAIQPGLDDAPKITTVHIPEADDSGLGGYTHEPGGITVPEFKEHVLDAMTRNNGITHLPGHEILLSLLHPVMGSWGYHGSRAPEWVRVAAHPGVKYAKDYDGPKIAPHGEDVTTDLEAFLAKYWGCPTASDYFNTSDPEELLVRKELRYWTRSAPGDMPPGLELPDARALYLDDGRVMNNNNDGGGQVGYTGAATASSATSLTNSGAAWTTNQWAGCRVWAQASSSTMVWANVISNTATVLTVDRWYAPATPGGAAGATPSATGVFAISDGGMVSTWFMALATGSNSPVHSDHTLSTNGNAEITTSGGGLIRKIAPYAQTSGIASRSFTLTPVWTANGSDSLPAVVTTLGVFASMVVAYGGAGGPMKFEPALTSSATFASPADQLTATETVTGS